MPDLNLIERTIVRREAVNYFKALFSHWSTYATAIAALVGFMTPSLNAYIAAHPHSTAGVLLSAALFAYHASAPKDAQK